MEAPKLVALYKKTLEKKPDRLDAERPHLDDREERHIGALLDQFGERRDAILGNKFDEDKNGHFEFETKSYSNFEKPVELAGSIDIVYPVFVERKSGDRIPLGQIGRKMDFGFGSGHNGWVDSFIRLDGKHVKWEDDEPITPADSRWEAIVEPFERAVSHCLDKIS